ncbi:putative cadaverine/lysine antiporter [Candidatus Profftia lariciata]|uniref:cadaverine/lysine antiporter n=1 Tax=Candidatus Profftia lariciata TaxID=1987921 RepID=UPI001D02A969|nr:cadaverine/lysine antiporter [Candidatus Profftia lariciata]UDG81292.1 putative cadaverine/lysine antiporter [Candidatus Profftia lariciata]
MASKKKIGLITCTGIVAGNMMGSGIALLPTNLAKLGSITIIGWIIAMIGAIVWAYVYARLSNINPQEGGLIAYAGEISPVLGFQTSVLYYHANWIGNLVFCITAVSYLSTFYSIFHNPVSTGITCIIIIWILTFINILGGMWVSSLTTIGLILLLIPVVGTGIAGWHWFEIDIYKSNWNISGNTDYNTIIKSITLCLWAFIGVESATVTTNIVKNPKRNIPIATILGTCIAGVSYISATQVIAGMYPTAQIAASNAPFNISVSTIVSPWAGSLVSIFITFACLSSLCSWMMLVGQAGVRAAHDGNFPKVYGDIDKYGIPRKGLCLSAIKMTILMIIITIINVSGIQLSELFGELTKIVVLLIILPYFYSCINLICFDNVQCNNMLSLFIAILGCLFCLIVLIGANYFELVGFLIISLTVLMFYAIKIRRNQLAKK